MKRRNSEDFLGEVDHVDMLETAAGALGNEEHKKRKKKAKSDRSSFSQQTALSDPHSPNTAFAAADKRLTCRGQMPRNNNAEGDTKPSSPGF